MSVPVETEAASSAQRIVDALKPLAEVYRARGDVHRYHAYRNAIDTVKSIRVPIVSAAQLKGEKGIGKAMLEKIDEILRTGHLRKQEELALDPTNAALTLFTAVHGIGAVAARKLVDLGFRTVEDLRTPAAAAHVPHVARIALKHHDDSQLRIPYYEIDAHLRYIRGVLQTTVDARLVVNCCGSHRRGLATSGDIDVLLTHPSTHSDAAESYVYLAAAVDALQRSANYIVDSLAEGGKKFMGYCRLASATGADPDVASLHTVRRLDMRFVPFDNYYCALLYFTGSDMFNINMRQHALKRGFTLNEYRLCRLATAPSSDAARIGSPPRGDAERVDPVDERPQVGAEVMEVRSEKDLFDRLGLPFVEPRDRCA